MIRFFALLALICTYLCLSPAANAQTRLADLAGAQAPRTLIAGGAAQVFELNLPDGHGAATLSLSAWPSDPLPAPGETFLISINNAPATPLTPALKPFTAQFDIPASQLRAGHNTISIWLEPLRAGLCAPANAGHWSLSLVRSRLDVAVAGRVQGMAGLENWLSADIGGPGRIAYDLSTLPDAAQLRAGAVLTQALSLRRGEVPDIVANGALPDLLIRVELGPGPAFALTTGGIRPILRIRAETLPELQSVINWFAENRLPRLPLPGPVASWPKQAVYPVPDLLDQLRKNGFARFRLPPSGEARLLLDVGANAKAQERTQLLVRMDGKDVARPALWRRMNSIAIDLPPSQHPDHVLDLRIMPIQSVPRGCHTIPPTLAAIPDLHLAQLQLAGTKRVSELERLAWHGGRISNDAGRHSLIALPASDAPALRQAWRLSGRLAILSGHALTRARYVAAENTPLPRAANMMWIGGRTHLPKPLLAGLPPGFAPHRGQAPGDPPKKYSPVNWIDSAQAAAPDPMLAVGVAAISRLPDGEQAVVLSAEMPGRLAEALSDLSDGAALAQFSGTLVRWRGDEALVNATASPVILRGPVRLPEPGYWLSLLLVLLPTALWSSLHLLMQDRKGH